MRDNISVSAMVLAETWSTKMARYQISDAKSVSDLGLPKYFLGTWDHYNTHLGEACLARVSGKGRKLVRINADEFKKMSDYGIASRI